jgi:hypothetical protein
MDNKSGKYPVCQDLAKELATKLEAKGSSLAPQARHFEGVFLSWLDAKPADSAQVMIRFMAFVREAQEDLSRAS